MTPLVDFLEGRALNFEGYSVQEVLRASDAWLEKDHAFIQWLFPTPTPSRYNLSAPVLTPEDADLICSSIRAQANFRAARIRMQSFYTGNTHWLRRGDHNHLRIARILEATTLLEGREAGAEFLQLILARFEKHGTSPPPETLRIWQKKLDAKFDDGL